MALREGLGAELSGVHADDHRLAMAGQVVRSAAGVPRSGLFPPAASTLISSTATMNVSIAAFAGFAVRDNGPVFLANDGPTNVLIGNAPGANSRLDVIYAKQNDASSYVTTPDANNLPVFGVLAGVASATPVRNPAGLPAGALELGTILVPSTATNSGSAGVVITPTFQYTAMAGGVTQVRNSTELAAWAPADGGFALQLDTWLLWERVSGLWVRAGISPWLSYTPTLTNLTVGAGGSNTAEWRYEGDYVRVRPRFQLGSGGSMSGSIPSFTLPVAAATPQTPVAVFAGVANYHDVSAAIGYVGYVGLVSGSTTTARFLQPGAGNALGPVTGATPFAFDAATGDILAADFSYRI